MNAGTFCKISVIVINPQHTKREREEEEEQRIPKRPNHLSETGEFEGQPSDHLRGAVLLRDLIFHEEIGSGSYGKVMLASHSDAKQQFAVKMVKKRLLRGSRDSIFAERRALELTQDSHLFTHCYATFQNEDYLFYMMEYVSGDLGKFLDQRAPCDMATTRFISAEIVSALKYLHNKGVIHRDLKPQNVLLDSAGHIKIADFGLAAVNVFRNDKVRKCVGTSGYMAPEVLWCLPYSSNVDYFSFGVILFELATGELPFKDEDDTEVIRSPVLHVEYPVDLHPHIESILQGLFCSSSTQRQAFCNTICATPFFKGINWADLEAGRVAPPYTMQPAPVVDTTTRIPLDALLTVEDSQKSPSKKKELIHGFSYKSNKPY